MIWRNPFKHIVSCDVIIKLLVKWLGSLFWCHKKMSRKPTHAKFRFNFTFLLQLFTTLTKSEQIKGVLNWLTAWFLVCNLNLTILIEKVLAKKCTNFTFPPIIQHLNCYLEVKETYSFSLLFFSSFHTATIIQSSVQGGESKLGLIAYRHLVSRQLDGGLLGKIQ